MSDSNAAYDISKCIHNMIRSYVMRKSEAKSGISWDSFKDKKEKNPKTGKEYIAVPAKYREAREKVCSQAFLRFRSCKCREDFITYFTGTICSVPQYLPKEEFKKLSEILLQGDKWEDVKAVSMLALSGLSRI
jgi:CRISPR-associated protein Cmx8